MDDNRLSIAHNYEQNGDLMADPDMTFVFDREAGTLTARTFQQDGLGVYQRVEGSNGGINHALERQLNTFAAQWFKNIREQGYHRELMNMRYADDELELVYADDGSVRLINGEVTLAERYAREHGIVLPAEPQATENVPDPSITAAERNQYGYTEDDMYPLSAQRAVELYDTGHPIYLLFPDNTEALAEDRDEVITFSYVCYNKTRHAELCDGQTGYTVHKLDAVIETVVCGLFARLQDLPKEAIIAARCAEQIAETQRSLVRAREALQADTAEVLEYEAEVIKVIRGESRLSSDLLNKLHEDAKARAEASSLAVRQLEAQLQGSEERQAALSQQYDSMLTWADMYGQCDMAAKKMIVARLMRAVRVSRDYQVEIELTVDCEQLGISLASDDMSLLAA